MSKWGWTYSAATVFGVILIGAALALSIIYIQNYQEDEKTYYGFQIGSVAMSTFIVLYIVVTIAFFRPYSSFAYTFGSVAVLVGGLATEIIFDQATPDNEGKKIGLYMLAGINSLVRLFLLIQVRCDEPLTSIGDVLNRIKRDTEKVGAPVKDIIKQSGPSLESIDINRVLGQYDSALSKTEFSAEEKAERRSRFRDLLGMNKTGGRR
jgi:hypothetical protein